MIIELFNIYLFDIYNLFIVIYEYKFLFLFILFMLNIGGCIYVLLL